MNADLDMSNFKLINLKEGLHSQDAVTVHRLNNTKCQLLHLTGGIMWGDIEMGNNRILQLADSTLPNGVVSKGYIKTI